MSWKGWRFVFDPLTGSFDLKRIKVEYMPDGNTGGTITSGTLAIPDDTDVSFNGGVAVDGSGSLQLDAGSTVILAP